MQSHSKITVASTSSSAPADPWTPQGQGRWADLPEGLLHSIIPLLGSFLDLLAFAGTCRSWRAAFATYPSKPAFRALLPPLLVRPPTNLPVIWDGGHHKLPPAYFQVTDLANPSNAALRCRIPPEALQRKPFAGSSYGQLICTSRHKDCLVILDVFTGARVLSPHLPFCKEDVDLICGLLTAPPTSPNSHLLICAQPNGSHQYPLLDWPVGSESWSELWLDDAPVDHVVDLNGQLIAMDFRQRLYTVSLAPNLGLQEVATVWPDGTSKGPFLRPWLVVCGDMLLIVDHHTSFLSRAPVVFEAYRLNMSTNPAATWEHVGKLENHSLFVGDDVRASPLSCTSPGKWGGRSNCLYYAHGILQPWSLHGLGDEADAVWDDDSNDRRLVFNRNWYGQMQPFWLYPSMFYSDDGQ